MPHVKQVADMKTKIGLVLLSMIALALSCCLATSLAWAEEGEDSTVRSVETPANTINVNQLPDSSFLYDTNIEDLSSVEAFHDAQIVQVRGEVVGDRINDEIDPSLCWITLQSLNEKSYATVSVLMSHEQADLIDTYGNYRENGTELQVRGVFYLSCPEHQGLSDIHAQEVSVLHAGESRDTSMNFSIMWEAILLLGLGLICLFTYRYLRERGQ